MTRTFLIALLSQLLVMTSSAPIVPFPNSGRYLPWSETPVPESTRRALGYNTVNWNTLFTNPIEEDEWFDINRTDTSLGNAVLSFMTAAEWDCTYLHRCRLFESCENNSSKYFLTRAQNRLG